MQALPRTPRGRQGKEVASGFTVHSSMVLLDSLDKCDKLEPFLLSLAGYKGLRLHNTSLMEGARAVELADEEGFDIDGAV